MALTLVTAATAEPITLDELKEHLRLDTDHDDAYVNSCITAARHYIEGQTHHVIMQQTWSYTIDYHWPERFGSRRIDFPTNPVTAQTSPSTTTITYVDTNGVSQTLAQTQYTVLGRRHGSYIVPAYEITWPEVRHVPDAITVQYQSGYATTAVPQELHRAMLILAAHYYENREVGDLPAVIEALVSPFRYSRVQ